MVAGFGHALGATLSEKKKDEISSMLDFGLSPAQVMTQHKHYVRGLAMSNAPVTRDTFVLPQDVRNLNNRKAEENWRKHPCETESMKMWKDENPDSVFYFTDHGLVDLNHLATKQDETPFRLGIQTPWQFEMMLKFGNGGPMAMDATFGTNHARVSSHALFHYFILCTCS
jgi:hypothetical protein